MMKVGYFADGPWSQKAIEIITDSVLFEVVFIVPRFDTQDPVLKKWAAKLEVPFLPSENVNSPEFIALIDGYKPDLLVSMSFNQILKKDIIAYPPKGFINCHAGALPFYRGRNPLNWVLINGENTFGITVHYVDEGIDTGDIIEQKHYPISTHDTYSSLLNIAVTECGEILLSAMQKISEDKVMRITQQDIHPVGTYFGMRTVGDENVDFNWPLVRIFNFIRAISSPGPGARFWVERVEYAIEEAVLIPDAVTYIATVGEVIGRHVEGVVVKAGDSALLIKKIRRVGGTHESKVFIPIFRLGTRLKSWPQATYRVIDNEL